MTGTFNASEHVFHAKSLVLKMGEFDGVNGIKGEEEPFICTYIYYRFQL